MTTIYMAGKISWGDWRFPLVRGLRDALPRIGDESDRTRAWPVLPGAVAGILDYVGPFFMSDDASHGNYHVTSAGGACVECNNPIEDCSCPEQGSGWLLRKEGAHGVAAGGFSTSYLPGMYRHSLLSRCLAAIDQADIVFAWLDDPTAYGTLCEIGYARAKGKAVMAAMPREPQPWESDLWFPWEMAQARVRCGSPAEALEWIVGYALCESPIEISLWASAYALGFPELASLVPAFGLDGGRYRLDFAVPEVRLGVELDGYEYHSSKEAFTKDRKREREIRSMGWDVIRFSGSEVFKDPDECLREIQRRAVDRAIELGVDLTPQSVEPPPPSTLVCTDEPVAPAVGSAAEARRRLQARSKAS